MDKLRSKLRSWLGVQDPLYDKKALEKIASDNQQSLELKFSAIEREMEFWKGIAKSYSAIPCDYCKEMMYVYPFGGAYYILPNTGKVHSQCYDAYLKEKEAEATK